jgi:hypothetical protein
VECNPLSMEEMVGCAPSRPMGKDGFSAATALGQSLRIKARLVSCFML